MSERFLRAYYYSFDATGCDAVDAVLEAVAVAGKAYHHTDQWSDKRDDGPSYAQLIQDAATEAAKAFSELVKRADEAESSLAGLADCINTELRENGPHDDQIPSAGTDMRPFVRRLVDRVNARRSPYAVGRDALLRKALDVLDAADIADDLQAEICAALAQGLPGSGDPAARNEAMPSTSQDPEHGDCCGTCYAFPIEPGPHHARACSGWRAYVMSEPIK